MAWNIYGEKQTMILDELDIKILRRFHDLKKDDPNIWNWTIDFFPEEKTSRERNKNYLKMIRHIKRMGELFIIDENGEKKITLDGDKVKFQKKKLPNGMRDCLVVQVEDLWNILELPNSTFAERKRLFK